MNRKPVIMIISILILFLAIIYLKGAYSPNQLEVAVRDYFEEMNLVDETLVDIYNPEQWSNGVIVAVEHDDMVGVVYLEKTLGYYKVKNHALMSKTDFRIVDSIYSKGYQYKIFRVESFVDDKDIMVSYLNKNDIESFSYKNESNEISLSLPNEKKIIFCESNNLITTVQIKTEESDEDFIEWEGKEFQAVIKYNQNDLVYTSEKPLNIALIGIQDLESDGSITFTNIELDDIPKLEAKNFDGLFIDAYITDENMNELISENWNLIITNPNDNLENNNSLRKNLVVQYEGELGTGSYYDSGDHILESTYLIVYGEIFENMNLK